MRIYTLAGIVLIFAGSFFLLRGENLITRQDAFTLQDVTASTPTRDPVGPWIAFAALMSGSALVAVGTWRKSPSQVRSRRR